MIIHEVLKNKPLESVWQAHKPIGSERLYLKLKKFKSDAREGRYILYRIEECHDKTYFWYREVNISAKRREKHGGLLHITPFLTIEIVTGKIMAVLAPFTF